MANSFKIKESQGNIVFSVNKEDVLIGAECLQVTGEGGTIFKDSIQTPLVRAASGNSLKYVLNKVSLIYLYNINK